MRKKKIIFCIIVGIVVGASFAAIGGLLGASTAVVLAAVTIAGAGIGAIIARSSIRKNA